MVDAHAYWQHPHFPRKQWDYADYEVKNESMAGAKDGGTLPGLALRRVAGKPFIVTEYNHASPNQYSAEAFLEVMAVAALQDWDGVFAFAYSHRGNDWDTKRFSSFFDIDQHPTKMATLPAALSLFYRADLSPAPETHTATVLLEEAIESIRTGGGSWVSAKNYGVKPDETFTKRVAMRLFDMPEPPEMKATAGGSAQEFTWDTVNRRMLVATSRSASVVGFIKEGETIAAGQVKFIPGATQLGWATLTATVVEGSAFSSARKILVTGTGLVENTGTVWKNAEKTTVGKDWGKAPSIVEGVKAQINFAISQKLKAWALDERGQRRQEVPLQSADGSLTLTLSPEHKTLWYELATE